MAATVAQELAAHLLAGHSKLGAAQPSRAYVMAPGRLRRVQDFMRANLARPLSLPEIATAAGASLFHFARGF